ncbi:MAG: hypothetical protein EPO28_10700 [Saprospiraceae bacterium]|nr:MAG: hypothetical protein EPO28_10700 [Saprospiraceae bacterium]
MKNVKKQIGIWLDLKEAFLIELQDGKESGIRKITSNIDTSHAKGGAPSGGRQGGTFIGGSEKEHNRRRQQQEVKYFDEIMKAIEDAGEVYVFGPGEAKNGLLHNIKVHRKQFHAHLMAVDTADYLTENQMVAQVKRYFKEGDKVEF